MSKKPRTIPSCLLNRIDDKEAYKAYFKTGSTAAILELLKEELEARVNAAVKKSEKVDRYELPSWAEYQSDSIGYRRGLREIINLLDR